MRLPEVRAVPRRADFDSLVSRVDVEVTGASDQLTVAETADGEWHLRPRVSAGKGFGEPLIEPVSAGPHERVLPDAIVVGRDAEAIAVYIGQRLECNPPAGQDRDADDHESPSALRPGRAALLVGLDHHESVPLKLHLERLPAAAAEERFQTDVRLELRVQIAGPGWSRHTPPRLPIGPRAALVEEGA